MAIPIRRDLVAPFVYGYFTHFWFGASAGPVDPTLEQALSFGDQLCQREVGRGIKAAAFENGSVLFDFSQCENTPVIVRRNSLYNAVEPDERGIKFDAEISARLARTENKQTNNQSFYRTVIIAHILLLENAARKVSGIGMNLPRMENLADAIACHALAKTYSHRAILKQNLCLTNQALEQSFDDLSRALNSPPSVARSLELLKLSHYRHLDHRSAEALVLCWAVCESIVDDLWSAMIDQVRLDDKDRMTKKRIESLSNSSAFTASVKTETLELTGQLSIQQVQGLNSVRKLRNNWLHSLKEVEVIDAKHAIRVCTDLISSTHGIELLNEFSDPGGSGGGRFLDVFESNFPDFDLSKAYDG